MTDQLHLHDTVRDREGVRGRRAWHFAKRMKFPAISFIVFVACLFPVDAFEIQIDNGPRHVAEPNTFIPQMKANDGLLLLTWLGGEKNIDRILIRTASINTEQSKITDDSIRKRFTEAKCVNSQKGFWSYAPLSEGTIYLKSGQKIHFELYLSGISLNGNLFAP